MSFLPRRNPPPPKNNYYVCCLEKQTTRKIFKVVPFKTTHQLLSLSINISNTTNRNLKYSIQHNNIERLTCYVSWTKDVQRTY